MQTYFERFGKHSIAKRASVFFLTYAVPKKLGLATLYLGTYSDANGLSLEGDKTYRFHIPPNVPAKQYGL